MPQTINNPFEKKGGASGKRVNRGAVPNQETVKRVEVKEEVSPQVSSTTDIDDLFSSGGESFSLDGVSTEESFAREEKIEQNVQQAPSRPTTVERHKFNKLHLDQQRLKDHKFNKLRLSQ